MGCFLFQLPPIYRYTNALLNSILDQLDPTRRNVIEFRHKSWWNETVYSAFRENGTTFCSCSGPRLPDELVRTTDDVYIRMHGPVRWYRHDYSMKELTHDGLRGLRPVARNELGFTSIMTTMHVPPKTQQPCGDCSRNFSLPQRSIFPGLETALESNLRRGRRRHPHRFLGGQSPGFLFARK